MSAPGPKRRKPRADNRSGRASATLRVLPATPDRWDDLVQLFGPRGACGGCWCMVWRLPPAEWREGKTGGNRRALQRLVASGDTPGLIAYDGAKPVGWIALAPREAYPRLERARSLKPIDETPVWSVTCFFVTRSHRRRGVSARLLRAAAEFARERGAVMIEGYPVVSTTGSMPDAFAWTGLPGSFERAGFREVARPSASRRIMRKALRKKR